MEDVPEESRGGDGSHRLLRRTDDNVPFALRVPRSPTRTPRERSLRRHENPTAAWTARQLTEVFRWDEAPRYLPRDRNGRLRQYPNGNPARVGSILEGAAGCLLPRFVTRACRGPRAEALFSSRAHGQVGARHPRIASPADVPGPQTVNGGGGGALPANRKLSR